MSFSCPYKVKPFFASSATFNSNEPDPASSNAPWSIYNIGNNKPEITIKQLAKNFSKISQKLYGFKPRLIFKKSKDTIVKYSI